MKRGLALFCLCAALPVAAQMRPSPSDGDRRIQSVRYDPDQVVTLEVASGTQLSVALLSGERIETIAVGDSAAWQLSTSKRGDYLFVKNLGAGGSTNATVVTDARVYSFEFIAGYGNDAAYLVRFEDTTPPPQVAAQRQSPTPYLYRLSGAGAIRPLRVTAEQDRVVVEWPPGRALPAIFRIDEDAHETLANSMIEDGKLVIDGAPRKLVFRLDRQMATATRVLPKRRRT
jgi:type IV secretion system protein VirB9